MCPPESGVNNQGLSSPSQVKQIPPSYLNCVTPATVAGSTSAEIAERNEIVSHHPVLADGARRR